MTSDRNHKIWLWDGSAWQEITRFTGFSMQCVLNHVPSMSATFYLTTTALTNLMVSGTPFRITGKTSTDGTVETLFLGNASGETGAATGSREYMSGYLTEVHGDEKSAVVNNTPVLWNVTGSGWAGLVSKMSRDASTATSGTAATVITDYLNDVNSRTASTVTTGTLDTGETIDVKHRQDEVYAALIDIAGLGDSTDKFTYYIHVDADSSFVPRVNYLSPTNALFTTTNPFNTDGAGTRDESRIVTEKTEARTAKTINEMGRVRNAINIKYKGLGTGGSAGSGQQSTGFATDATSITNYGRAEAIVYAPWIQDSATAGFYQNTLLNMFKGSGTYGIRRAETILKDGGLFGSAFDATLGDQVGIERTSGEVVQGKLMGFSYDQSQASTMLEIGLPIVPFFEEQSSYNRQNRQAVNSMQVTTFSGLTTPATSYLNGGTGLITSGTATFNTAIASGSSSVVNLSASDDGNGFGYYVSMSASITQAFDGPFRVRVRAVPTSGGIVTLLDQTFGASSDPSTGNIWYSQQFYPFATGNTLNHIDVTVFNYHNSQTLHMGTVAIDVLRVNQIDLSHQHNM